LHVNRASVGICRYGVLEVHALRYIVINPVVMGDLLPRVRIELMRDL